MCYEVSVGFQNVGRFENLVKTIGFMWQSADCTVLSPMLEAVEIAAD
jgi:hypothetical protein